MLVGTLKYRGGDIKTKGSCRKAQMQLKDLSDIHSGRNAEWV